MSNWKTVTKPSRSGKGKSITSTAQFGPIRLAVVNEHLTVPGSWAMNAFDLGIDAYDLQLDANEPVEKAQEAALAIARAEVKKMADALG